MFKFSSLSGLDSLNHSLIFDSFRAGEGRLGTDEKVFIEIFGRSSFAHLRRVFALYETIHKHHTMEKAIENEFSGHLKSGLHGIVVYVRNPGEFYADIAHRAMKGAGTNEHMLTRVIIGNRDVLPEIKQVCNNFLLCRLEGRNHSLLIQCLHKNYRCFVWMSTRKN